jgi:sec-independent protein translocase protein TatB
VFNITGGELVIIAVLALIVLGPDKLPDFVRRAGRVYGEIKKMSMGFKTEFRDVIEEPVREMQDTVNLAKSWFDEGRTAVETMDDSKWGTPEIATSDDAADSVDPAPQPADDAFGTALPAATTPSVPDEAQLFSGWGDESGEDEAAEQIDREEAQAAQRVPTDPTRVDSFLDDEQGIEPPKVTETSGESGSDSFGAVTKRVDGGEQSA